MRFPRFLAFAILLVGSAPMLRADDTEEFLKKDNWVGRDDFWKLEKNTITGETKEDPKYNTFFCSKAKYSDFELKYKVKLTDEVGNSGVQIRSTLKDEKKFVVTGPQVDVGKGYWGSLYGEGYDMMKKSDSKLVEKFVKGNEFNEFHVIAKGTKITIKVNGETFVDDDFKELPGKDKKEAPKDGIIAFQIHAGKPMKVEFTDITFKNLAK